MKNVKENLYKVFYLYKSVDELLELKHLSLSSNRRPEKGISKGFLAIDDLLKVF